MNMPDDDEDNVLALPLPPAGQRLATDTISSQSWPPLSLKRGETAAKSDDDDEDIPLADLSKYAYSGTPPISSTLPLKPRRPNNKSKLSNEIEIETGEKKGKCKTKGDDANIPEKAPQKRKSRIKPAEDEESKKRGKRTFPPKPLDLSSLPLPSVRTLQMCPMCSQSFSTNKTGPSKLLHLSQCASSKSFALKLVTDLVKVEVQRLIDAKRKEESKKTLFEKTVSESIIVGREGRKRRAPLPPPQEVKFSRGLDVASSTSIQSAEKSRVQARKELDSLLSPPPEFEEPQRTQGFQPSKLAQRKSLRRENSHLFNGQAEHRPLLDVVRKL